MHRTAELLSTGDGVGAGDAPEAYAPAGDERHLVPPWRAHLAEVFHLPPPLLLLLLFSNSASADAVADADVDCDSDSDCNESLV